MSTSPVLDLSVQRDQLREKILATDPAPPRCTEPGHGDPERWRRSCDTCKAYYNWRCRLNYRLRRGEPEPPEPVDDPKPPPCPQGHVKASRYAKLCDHCRAYEAWRGRDYRRRRRAGQLNRYDNLPRLRDHLAALEGGGLLIVDLAKKTGLREDTLRELRAGQKAFVTPDTAERILDIPVPERRLQLVPTKSGAMLRRIDSTGTRRRIRCAQRAGHTIDSQAAKLGWSRSALDEWLASDTVTVDVADAVAMIYPQLIANPGTSSRARAIAASKGCPEARYFSETNIDDPTYDPFRIVDKPYGVYRRLRAFAYIGQGPAQVASRIGEEPEMVELWMEGGPAPAYAHHLVAADYERWCTTPGPDREAAARARREGWGSPLAWDDISMDKPTAHPSINKLRGFRAAELSVTSAIYDALDGRVTRFDLRHDELVDVVWILHRRRWSDRRIAAWLRWNPDGDLEKGRVAVGKWRENNGVIGFGDTGARDDTLFGLIVEPSAA